jgi:hypothetical protein
MKFFIILHKLKLLNNYKLNLTITLLINLKLDINT